METRRVGSSGLQVSRLGLGTMTWGRDVDVHDARHLLRDFTKAGGTLVDTAPAYGRGAAEEILGHLIAADLQRSDVVIATKAGFGIRDGQRVTDTSRGAMLSDLTESLHRLRTDHVDLWQVHAWGDAPLEETLAALDHALASGMTRYVGVSNFVGWQTAWAATWQQAVPGRARLASSQIEYSLLARRAEVEVIPALRAMGMGLFPWSPIGRGVLTGKYRAGTPLQSRGASEHFGWFVEPYLEPKGRAITDAVGRAAEGLDLTAAQVALLWVRDAPGVTAPLLGARNAEQLAPFLEIDDVSLPAPIVSALDDITGGPNLGR
jgi:aryl-alcohol dehydrogenase-like predicted oxidoreductase